MTQMNKPPAKSKRRRNFIQPSTKKPLNSNSKWIHISLTVRFFSVCIGIVFYVGCFYEGVTSILANKDYFLVYNFLGYIGSIALLLGFIGRLPNDLPQFNGTDAVNSKMIFTFMMAIVLVLPVLAPNIIFDDWAKQNSYKYDYKNRPRSKLERMFTPKKYIRIEP